MQLINGTTTSQQLSTSTEQYSLNEKFHQLHASKSLPSTLVFTLVR